MGSEECPFCGKLRDQAFEHLGGLAAAYDEFPLTKGHVLIFPDGWHARSFSSLTGSFLWHLIVIVQARLRKADPTISGWNIGINDGEAAGQTIPHAHLHLIPRRDGDCEDPRGGIRLMFGEKGKYWKTT